MRRLFAVALVAAAAFAGPASADPGVGICVPGPAADPRVCVTVIECARICMVNPDVEVVCTPEQPAPGVCRLIQHR